MPYFGRASFFVIFFYTLKYNYRGQNALQIIYFPHAIRTATPYPMATDPELRKQMRRFTANFNAQ